jgi:hypothetical protein
MKPSELSKNLRTIAAKIDASRKPDRVLVSRDLKRIISKWESITEDPIAISVNGKDYTVIVNGRNVVIYQDENIIGKAELRPGRNGSRLVEWESKTLDRSEWMDLEDELLKHLK